MTPVENKTLVQEIMEARARRDPAPFLAAMADDFVWRIIGSTAWSGEYVGKAAIRERLLKPLYAQFTAPSSITSTRILADGDYVVAECRGDATTVLGERYANTYCFVMRLADGQLKENDRIYGHCPGRARTQAAWRLDFAFTRRCGSIEGRSPFAIHSS